MTLPGYFWDRWPYFAGTLSWDITTTQVNSALHPSGVAKSSTSFGWGKGVKVTSAGWQITLCDLIWHVISRSGVVISITNCYIRLTYLLTLSLPLLLEFRRLLETHLFCWRRRHLVTIAFQRFINRHLHCITLHVMSRLCLYKHRYKDVSGYTWDLNCPAVVELAAGRVYPGITESPVSRIGLGLICVIVNSSRIL